MNGVTRSARRIARGLLAGMMVSVLPTAAGYAVTAPELAVVGGTGNPGETVQVVIRLSGDPANAAVSADLDIAFPTDLIEFDPPVSQGCRVASRLAATHQVGGQLPRPGLLRFALFARALEIHPLGDGELATCDFHVPAASAVATAALGVEFAALGDAAGQLLPVVSADGAIVIDREIPAPTPTVPSDRCAADCNGDGQLTIDELIRSVGIALGNLPLAECPESDGSGDGAVSVSELIRGVNGAMGSCGS